MLLHRSAINAVPLLLVLGGCSGDGYDYAVSANSSAPESVASYSIDTNQTMTDIRPGQEAGAFIEYQAGGRWHVYVTCDSEVGRDCVWDILTQPASGSWSGLTGQDLEANDQLTCDQWGPWMVARTRSDYDGFYFSVRPGEAVRFDVFLDGAPAPGYVRWVSGNGVNPGSASNPLDLQPNSP